MYAVQGVFGITFIMYAVQGPKVLTKTVNQRMTYHIMGKRNKC
jgi:hypothetical protein